MADRDYDVVIIGTGAGGGTLAHALAPTGARILVLERGGRVPREAENWSPQAVWRELRYRAVEEWLDADGQPFTPYTH
jgi:choline dehydrogenase-like flavoprotein